MRTVSRNIIFFTVSSLLVLFALGLIIPVFSVVLKHKNTSLSTSTSKKFLVVNTQDDEKTLETLLNEWNLHDVKWTREQLEILVRKNPKNYVAWYWIAVASHRDLDDSKRAKEALVRIIKAKPKQPTWLMPWSYFRLGMVASSEGHKDKAIKLFHKVLLFRDDSSGFYYAAQDELSKLENPEE
jgi:tetratricopeptide (TPR) repeat protein